MDLRSIMNKGDAEEKKSSPPSVSRIVPPPNPSDGQPFSAGPHPHLVNTTHHRPPSSGMGAASPHARTPSQSMGGTHYPFPQQPHTGPGPFTGHSSQPVPPSAIKPPSHIQTYNQHPSQYSSHPASQGRLPTQSPTSSRHSQTPHSLRQSPLPGSASLPHHAPHSQPSTPLGPPTLPHQRVSSQFHEPPSPYHGRTLSGASNGFGAGSPGTHNVPIGSLVDSPSVPPRHSPYRRASDYSDGRSRERSVSVSPKTMIPPRPPSLGSRSSSQQDVRSATASVQPPEAHHTHRTHSPYATSHVSQHTSSSAPSPQAPNPLARTGMPTPDGSLSHQAPLVNNHHPIQHQTQKMGMDHLLSPATEGPKQGNGSLGGHGVPAKPPQISTNHAAAHSPMKAIPPALPPTRLERALSSDKMGTTHSPATKAPLKRPAAEAQFEVGPLPKRGKTRKYNEPPIWARLAPQNPKYGNRASNGAPGPKPQHAVQVPQSQQNGMPQIPASQPPDVNLALPPWQQQPPLDMDLIKARAKLGQWERSIIYNEPYLDLHRVVQDWLFVELEKLGDIGNDPMEGAVEIEAKIGYIKSKSAGERLRMPIKNAVVLDESFKDSIHFESEMELTSHRSMNDFLNKATQNAMMPGRARSDYTHPRLTDSFHPLSTAGFNALPVAFQRRPRGRELSLRTSTDDKTGKVVARIVKIPIANLHIFNPGHAYDCRISINLEANLNRPDLAPYTDLYDDAQAPRPDRKKDRMSYKHLAYAIDLTKVETPGLAPKFELEVEVDPGVLRDHQQRCKNSQEHAYQDIVAGFINNVTLLMRQQRVA